MNESQEHFNIPNPETNSKDFNTWINSIQSNNDSLSDNELSQIKNLTLTVLKEIIQQLAVTTASYLDFVLVTIEKMLEEKAYQETIVFIKENIQLEQKENLKWHHSVMEGLLLYLVEAGSLSNDLITTNKYYNELNKNWSLNNGFVYKSIGICKTHSKNENKLTELQLDINTFLQKNTSSSDANYGWISQAYLYFTKNDLTNCKKALQQIDYRLDVMPSFIKKVFNQDAELLKIAEDEIETSATQLKNFIQLEKKGTNGASGVKLKQLPAIENDFIFYKHTSIEIEKYKGVLPISESLFVAYDYENTLFLIEITNNDNIKNHQTIPLDYYITKVVFHNQKLYVQIWSKGIVVFSLKDKALQQVDLIKNDTQHPRYNSFSIQEDLLFSINFNILEIFKYIEGKYQLIHSDFFIGSSFNNIEINKNMACINKGSGVFLLVDVSNLKTPKSLSFITNFRTNQNSKYIHWADNQLHGKTGVIDISNPEAPKALYAYNDDVAPCYNFSSRFKGDFFSREKNGIIMTRNLTQEQPLFKCLDEYKQKPYTPFFHQATVLTDDTLIVFKKREIVILTKEKINA